MKYLIIIFILVSCQKEDCDCGYITGNVNDGKVWTIEITYDCGNVESTDWHFPLDEMRVGDRVCDLKEINLNDLKL